MPLETPAPDQPPPGSPSALLDDPTRVVDVRNHAAVNAGDAAIRRSTVSGARATRPRPPPGTSSPRRIISGRSAATMAAARPQYAAGSVRRTVTFQRPTAQCSQPSRRALTLGRHETSSSTVAFRPPLAHRRASSRSAMVPCWTTPCPRSRPIFAGRRAKSRAADGQAGTCGARARHDARRQRATSVPSTPRQHGTIRAERRGTAQDGLMRCPETCVMAVEPPSPVVSVRLMLT